MDKKKVLFQSFLTTAFDQGDYTTDDVIAFLLPLAKKLLSIHESGLIMPLGEPGTLLLNGRILDLDAAAARPPSQAPDKIRVLFGDLSAKNIEVVGKIKISEERQSGDPAAQDTDPGRLLRSQARPGGIEDPENLRIHLDPAGPLQYPAYLPGYGSYETLQGHHDAQTDIFSLGLLLGSMALGLDLYKERDLRRWAVARSNPTVHQPRIHPTVGRLITEMTELDRRRRTQDLYEVIRRLEHYREHDPQKQEDLSDIAGWRNTDIHEREAFILQRLRNRLFDISRRNRLLYYKPNMRFVNLTVSSVPVVLHYQSIRPELLFTWNEELGEKIRGMKEIVLNKYLRFDDHPYLPASLDKVRIESRRSIQEYGLSQCRLVVAFLSWNNLKEDPGERIQSPLLLVPAELKKSRRLKEDHYVLKVLDNAAEVNPVLAGQLKDLYGIRLPDFIDLDEISPQQFHQHLQKQIEAANQGIALNYIDKPRIMLIHREARQTVDTYKKRVGLRQDGGTDPGMQEAAAGPAPGADLTAVGDPMQGPAADRAKEEGAPLMPEADPGQQLEYTLVQSENNPYSWDFDVCNMVLGNFNYKKMSLVRDYNLVIEQQLRHTVFDDLFSTQPRVVTQHEYNLNSPEDWYHVIKADPSQTKAILQSRAGYSYIIQGPPGTGKSQTITNLIADFVARGKSILFVCEKRAALDVVYHRLKQNGLDELCCYIHDSLGDKKEFIRDLKTTYEDFLDNRMDLPAIRARRSALLEKMKRQIAVLTEFHRTATSGEKEFGIDTRSLIERVIELRSELPALDGGEEELLPRYAEWQQALPILHDCSQALQETGSDPVFASHPFSRIRDEIYTADNPVNLLGGLLQRAFALLDQLAPVLAPEDGLEDLKLRVQYATLLQPLSQAGHLGLADPVSSEAREFGRKMAGYQDQQQGMQETGKKNIHWRQRIEPGELDACIALAAQYEDSFWNFLNSRWRQLKKHIDASYDLSAHVVRPTYKHILQNLASEYEARRQLEQAKRGLQQEYRMDNIDTARLTIELLQNKKGDPVLERLLHGPDAATQIGVLYAIRQPLGELEDCLRLCLQDPGQERFPAIRQILENIQQRMDHLPMLLSSMRSRVGLPTSVKSAMRHFSLTPLQIEAAIARKTLHEIYQSNRSYQAIDRQTLENAVFQLGDVYTALQEVNADCIRALVRARFQQDMDLAGMASSQLDEEKKKMKKIINEGRKILENEFGKTMRYKSIRELSEKESGHVLKNIKPIWLMSPYSVSDSLPLDGGHFDVVIFDEASQITLEEGVPALYRSQQTIIVGDERQMPPSNFFGNGPTGSDMDELADGEKDDPEEWLQDDADSLLAQGARKLGNTLLSWHYRSHYETLISFSNHAFYGGNLLTIPDKTIHHGVKAPIAVESPADAVQQTNALFDRSISFHFHAAGLYEKRSNQPEAVYIAYLVRELLGRGIKESIGIVAFSQQQQQAIENALDELAAQDAIFSQRLEEAYTRTEQDQFVGLIVKNLENIQGDERDIIIMSVCYGRDGRGKMLMNFGPINKRGGEKRLNVLFSRARRHIAVISSIHYQDITNEYNEGASYMRRFLQYAEMVSLGNMQGAGAILRSLVLQPEREADRIRPGVFRQQLRQQIEYLGYEVAEQVGQSGFRCSLAVKARPGDEHYSLGILIDDGPHYQNTNLIEQYYLRPEIMKSFGWKVLPVFAKDWLHQPKQVLDKIQNILEAV